MFFFTPSYLKQAKLLHKGVTRFLDYKRDLLPQAKLDEILGLRTELEQAMKAKDEKRLEELSKKINQTCERAMPEARTTAMAENVEVFFVSIVIALGIRAYIAQPFQIPTGSMQPTLFGITAEHTEENPDKGYLQWAMGLFTGTTYLNVESDHEGDLARGEVLTEHHFLILRPYCKLHFEDGHTISINCPLRQLSLELGFNPYSGQHIKKGQLLARGLVHDGDHVIVNKFAYHFRRPARGEVFVFTTKNIEYIEDDRRNFDMRWGSQHYIKRLVGVPGDTLDVHTPELYINGQKATEPGIRRVIDQKQSQDAPYAYHGYSEQHDPRSPGYLPVTLATQPDRQYWAMGDNSYNSSDSRYFGPVPEQNIVGPGWFCYWPLTSRWGPIR